MSKARCMLVTTTKIETLQTVSKASKPIKDNVKIYWVE